ncbi:MAG TPA: gfo/Idh/MocA family oxidoreductase [Armatimonadetes bacterium]|nr:gfo/Idh/MocA family oxidoreductase [Armatimonadota bacterium]
MAEPIRVVVLGLSHDHVWGNIPNLQANPQVQIVAGWDVDPELRARLMERVPTADVVDDRHRLLHDHYPDVALVCGSNAESVDLVEEATSHGCHVIVEKPLANDLAGGRRMVAAAEEAGVKLIVNWPICWEPALWAAADLARSGQYGKLWQVRWRSSHNGPESVGCSRQFIDWLYNDAECGHGAFTDYTCYGAAVCAWLLGTPESVVGYADRLLKTQSVGADNAVLLLSYDGAFGQVEASWTQISADPPKRGLFHCAEALIEPDGNKIRISTVDQPAGEWVEVPAPPAHLASLGAYLGALLAGECEPAGILDAQVALRAQAIMEAGWEAAVSGQAQDVETS